MRLRWQIGLALAAIALLAGCGYEGDRTSGHVGGRVPFELTPMNTTLSQEPILSHPTAEVSVSGTPVDTALSSYTACDEQGNCTGAAMSIAKMPQTTVPGGARIEVKPSEGTELVSLQRMDAETSGDPYVVPEAKGVYSYRLQCEWPSDGGQAEYIFSLQAT